MRSWLALLLIIVGSVLAMAAVLFFLGDIRLPMRPPALSNTYTPDIQPAPLEIGSFDIMGQVVSHDEAQALLQTEAGRQMLSREQGAIEITQDLIDLGREVFYLETFGNEYVASDIAGSLDGPINLWTVSRAILALGGRHTTNLQVPVDEDTVIGGRTFPAGSVLDTGLDVPPGALLPLGMRLRISDGQIRTGITCALCHASVDPTTGTIIEGATNADINIGLILAAAPNSAAFFRRTDVNPLELPAGERSYVNSRGELALLPDARALEDAVDAALLTWPGTFDLTDDLVINPTFIPSSFSFGQWPYGWNGFASLGWFQGLSTLNNNVHAVTADVTNDPVFMEALLGIDAETYLGILLQNASSVRWRLPDGARPSEFFSSVTPTPLTPGVIDLVMMPDYPRGSAFVPNGLLAGSPGFPVGEQINALSAFQNRLAPPPSNPTDDIDALRSGAEVFLAAGCAECHSGRHFSKNQVIPLSVIGTQPSRAFGQVDKPATYVPPRTYPPSITAPPMPGVGAIDVPITTPEEIRDLAYAVDGEGGYKVVTLIGIYLQAPYLHDAGVAAGPGAFHFVNGRYDVADASQLGMAGTLMRGVRPDPAASLRALIDRRLRAPMIDANHAHPDLQRANIEGIGHEFWVDDQAGFTVQQQTDLIVFLLSLDDDPAVLPAFP
jgi:mono/diheme cytochrome c family protein